MDIGMYLDFTKMSPNVRTSLTQRAVALVSPLAVKSRTIKVYINA